ncbi:D-alanyl-D-alanine carboxypeptidase / D-alanyl-D-alanine-endopeptidase (penicillin-binding protein 4) [Parapedobacter composti]|uniref:D-alanyl-D-alanine carboxypeptidase / D-alanyl-D-alanine-endopeptidase (Penicillin-binding protein 4) n=1 Tax=Parapedobacter composti TaxID=623281 RepID=A0A1I1E7A5_9SPHI|nr:D-alanyl-D-alanine carboxypeptidase/D-alanyl-D-alanine-endopeptidase [Parapedobacter composti]SFB82512.1 D-alanyl-D-alanine carboxypeptidase / D-alanyl-D-alanine-endopeptidase (penicillin-binding protein 4) [Parapedobacter composti]
MLRLLFILFAISFQQAVGQPLAQKIASAYRVFESHESMANGIASLVVINANTGEVIFAKHEKLGLAPASTLKAVTAATAYHVLGPQHTFETTLFYTGTIEADGTLRGNIVIRGTGDPSLGSDRFPQTVDTLLLGTWLRAIQTTGIRSIEGAIIADDRLYNGQTAPGGWTWRDMGNYYGAGVSALNWRENAVGVNFIPGSAPGMPTRVANTTADISYLQLINEATTGNRGTGDRVYAYAAPYASRVYLRGTYGIDLKKTIYLSLPDGAYDAAYQLHRVLDNAGIKQTSQPTTAHLLALAGSKLPGAGTPLHHHRSPTLGELVYWFNQKSVNLYGEALLKAIADRLDGKTDTRDAAATLMDFWVKKLEIMPGELRILDGSGLSPENRITTHAMARILAAAKKEPWFGSFYESLPVNNGMKMKSGTISGVLGYAGYHTSKAGTPLVFALIVNNYQGNATPMRQRMFRLLDVLK